jgi:hypothetical protein
MISWVVVLKEVYHKDHLARKVDIFGASAAFLSPGCDIVSGRGNVSLGLNTCKCVGQRMRLIEIPAVFAE